MNIPEKLKEIRKHAGLTQQQVAQLLHVSRTTYVQYETGKRTVSAEMFFKIEHICKDHRHQLFMAIEKSDIKHVSQLIKKGIYLEHTNEYGERPFLCALMKNQPAILAELIAHGSPYHSDLDNEWEYEEGCSKLTYALQNGYLEIASLLLNSHFSLEKEFELLQSWRIAQTPLASRLLFQFHFSDQKMSIGDIEKIADHFLEKERKYLVDEHIELVDTFVPHYSGQGVDDGSLKSAGIQGLIVASKKYELHMGAKFSTYASWWVRQHIRGAIIEASGLPTYLYDTYYKFKKAYNEELQQTGKRLTKEELSILCDVELRLFEKIEAKRIGGVFWDV